MAISGFIKQLKPLLKDAFCLNLCHYFMVTNITCSMLNFQSIGQRSGHASFSKVELKPFTLTYSFKVYSLQVGHVFTYS